MKHLCVLLLLASNLTAGPTKSFDDYLSSFSYEERNEMKISADELVELMAANQVQLIDIRFREEHALWRIGPALNIPLNELPVSLAQLDKSKLIVTICPHIDRAALARHYLTMKGYKCRYLSGGMLKLIEEHMRGDEARDLHRRLNRQP